MTTKILQSAQERAFESLVREQLDAFERQERRIVAEERKERAAQLKLPLDRSKKAPPLQIHALENS
jgi:hypothetical protein